MRPSDSPRVVIAHRWAGSPDADFYPWLDAALAERAVRTERLALPAPDAPDVAAWPTAIAAALLAAPSALASTVLLGHSVGCQAAMRALALLPEGAAVRALVCVAGWWTVDAPWPTIVPWHAPFDFARAARGVERVSVLLSDDDPYTRDVATTRRLFEERFAAEVTVVPGARHFNASPQPAVLDAVVRALSR